MKLKGAIIGSGLFAGMHLDGYKQNKNVEIKYLCDLNIDLLNQYQKDYKIEKITKDYNKILQDKEIDFVDIMAPNFLHEKMTINALEAGKDVMCIKPMAVSIQECENMSLASKKTGKKLFIKYHQRYDPVHIRVCNMIQQGDIEPVIAIATLMGNHMSSMTDNSHWRGNAKLCGGGCLFSSGSHILDLLNFFFGKPKAVTAVNRQLLADNPDKEDDNSTVIIEFESGVVATFVGCWTTKQWTWSKEIIGKNSTLVINQIDKTNCLMKKADGKSSVILEQKDWFIKSNYIAIDSFIDYLIKDTAPLYSLEDSIESMRTLFGAYQSSSQARTVLL